MVLGLIAAHSPAPIMVDISSIIEGTVKFRDGKKVTRESRQGSTEGGGIKHQSNELAQSDSTASPMGGGGVGNSVGGRAF